MSYSPPTRLFTVDEANRSLPLVRRIVRDILAAGSRLRELSPGTEGDDVSEETHTLQERIGGLVEELHAIGCSYKDWNFDVGLVDFPASLDGRVVMLCWRSDEEQIRFFHEVHAGYAGRQALTPSFETG